MAELKRGQKVIAYPGGEERIGFVLDPAADADGKHAIQVGSDVHALAYRSPVNYDEGGSGGTFYKLGD